MLAILKALLIALIRGFRSHRDLILENLALRQQLSVLKAKHPYSKPNGPFALISDVKCLPRDARFAFCRGTTILTTVTVRQ